MMIRVDMTALEAASIMSLLAQAAERAGMYGDETQQAIYTRVARGILAAIKSGRTELSEAELASTDA